MFKEVQDNTSVTEAREHYVREHYVRDAQGNVMAIYRFEDGTGSMVVKERPLYGSSRIGLDAYSLELGGAPTYYPLVDPLGLLSYSD